MRLSAWKKALSGRVKANCCIMVIVLSSNVVYRGFEPRSCQTKDYAICFCFFLAKHAALRKKSKDWLARNQNNVSGWSNMSIRGLLPQTASTINIKLSRPHHRHHLIEN